MHPLQLILFTLLLLLPLKPAKGKPVKLSGWIETGLKATPSGESFSGGRVKIKTKRKMGARGVLSYEANTSETSSLKDAYIDYKLDDSQKVQMGQAKKRFGYEYDTGKLKRLAIKRSPLYRKLETFSYVGREMVFRYEKEAESYHLDLSMGYNETQDAHFLSHYKWLISPKDSLSAFLLLQSDVIFEGRQNVFAVDFSYSHKGETTSALFELLGGIDPDASQVEKLYYQGETIYFWGAKWQQGFRLENEKTTLFYQLTYIAHDTKEKEDNTLAGLLGVNHLITPHLQAALNLTFEGERTKEDSKRDFYRSGGAFEVRLKL